MGDTTVAPGWLNYWSLQVGAHPVKILFEWEGLLQESQQLFLCGLGRPLKVDTLGGCFGWHEPV
jgi:hypothetical protein